MKNKREQAQLAAKEAKARRQTVAKEQEDVMKGLRELGFGAAEARRAVESCKSLKDATLEDRVRAALKFLCPKARTSGTSQSAGQLVQA